MNNGIFQGIAKDFIGDGGPRRRIVTLTSSVPNLQIPSWAQGGKGIVYVTGGGGGGSGGVNGSVGAIRGGGGGSGAGCSGLPVPIPSGVTSVAATIGAGGAAANASATPGNDGGDSTLVVGSFTLTLRGGRGGLADASTNAPNQNGGAGGQINAPANVITTSAIVPTAPGLIFAGATGGNGSTSADGFGAGASSPFGLGGAGVADASAAPQGSAGTGYSSGGSGSRWAGSNASGEGRPGILVLEFAEGL